MLEIDSAFKHTLENLNNADNIEILEEFLKKVNDELGNHKSRRHSNKLNTQIRDLTTSIIYVGYSKQVSLTGSLRSSAFLKEVVDLIEGDTFEGEPIQKYLKRSISLPVFNEFFRVHDAYMKLLMKELLMNYPYEIPLLEQKHAEYFTTKVLQSTTVSEWSIQRYSEELEGHRRKRWKKISMVIERAYQEENYFLITQFLKECYPHIFKNTYKSIDDYSTKRGDKITPAEGLNELLAYFYLYNLPKPYFNYHVELQFYADLAEIYIQHLLFRDYLRYDIFDYTIVDINKLSTLKIDFLSPDINAVFNDEQHIKDTGLDIKYMKYSPYLVPHKKNENLCEVTDEKAIRFHDLILSATFYVDEHEEDLNMNKVSEFLLKLANINYYGDYLQEPVKTYDLMMLNELLRKQEELTGEENKGKEFIAAIHYYVSTLGSHTHSREIVFYNEVSKGVSIFDENEEKDEQALKKLFKENKKSVYKSDLFLDLLNKDMLSLKKEMLEKDSLKQQKTINRLSKSLEKYKLSYKQEKRAFSVYKKEINAERKEIKQFQQEKHEIIKSKERLSEQLDKQEEENKRLLKEIDRLKDKVVRSFENATHQQKDIEMIKEELISYLKNHQVAIIGGHVKWQNKLGQEFAEVANNINMIDIDKRVVLDFLDTTKHIFIVSKYNNHGYSYLVDRNKKPHNEIHYLDTTNIEHTLREMHQALFEG